MSKSRTISKPTIGFVRKNKAKAFKRRDGRSPFIVAGEVLADHPGWEYFWEAYNENKQKREREDADELCLS